MQKRLKSPIPIILTGCIFFIYSLIFPMFRYTDIVIGLAVAGISYFIFNKLISGKIIDLPPEMAIKHTGNERADDFIKQGRDYIRRLDELDNLINNEKVSAQINHLAEVSLQIFDFIAKNPTQARKINTFMEYYFPTALKLLESYNELSGRTVKGENISMTLDRISTSLKSIETAFEHQLDSLYSDKALDIKTDIAVLENIIEREGLK